MIKLSIIIVSFNTQKLLGDCLDSLKPQLSKSTEVIIVDNNSTDNSVSISKKIISKLKIIKNKDNLGYAKANNQGIKASRGEYLLLLNSDTVLGPNTLNSITKFLDDHSKVGIASPTLLNKNKSIQLNGGNLPHLLPLIYWAWFFDDLPIVGKLLPSYHSTNKSDFQKTKAVGWVSGAAMIIRKTTLEDIGLLDEDIFMYGEDTDLCWRAHNSGWQVFTTNQSTATHLGQGSGSSISALSQEFVGLKHLYKKHKPHWQLVLLRFILKSAALFRILLFGKIYNDAQKEKVYTNAFKMA